MGRTLQQTHSRTSAKVAIVTGAARGIGLEVSRYFLAKDWRVAMIDIDGPTLSAVHENILATSSAKPDQIISHHSDVSVPKDVLSAVAHTRESFGRVDALVNNAGIATFKPLLETSYDDWREVMKTNLDGPFLCGQACAPIMAETGGGAIINIASISGLRASLLRVAYGTSKAAIIHLTKQQAAELGELGIRVNAIAPGPVDTAMAKKVHSPDIRADYHNAIPLNRYGDEREIAASVYFLCSDEASYITGQTLAVDGGFAATGIGLESLRTRQEQ